MTKTTKSRQVGRAPKPANSARSERIEILLTPREASQLREAARSEQLTVSDYVRGQLRSPVPALPASPAESS